MNSFRSEVAYLVERSTSGLLAVRGISDLFILKSFIEDLSKIYLEAIRLYEVANNRRLFLIVSRPLEQHLCLYCSRGASQSVVL